MEYEIRYNPNDRHVTSNLKQVTVGTPIYIGLDNGESVYDWAVRTGYTAYCVFKADSVIPLGPSSTITVSREWVECGRWRIQLKFVKDDITYYSLNILDYKIGMM